MRDRRGRWDAVWLLQYRRAVAERWITHAFRTRAELDRFIRYELTPGWLFRFRKYIPA